MEDFVSEGRLSRISPRLSPAKRMQHLVAGYLLERYLFLEGYPATFSYGYHESGKPYLVLADGMEAPHFSITHSGSKVACAISPCPVGIDIEDRVYGEEKPTTKERLHRITNRFFSEEEQTYLTYYPEEFYQIWTFKEAVAKAFNEPMPEVLHRYCYRNVLKKIQDVDMSQSTMVEDHIFLVKTSIQVERESASTKKNEKNLNKKGKNSGFYRLQKAPFVGFLVDKGNKDS